MYIASLRIRGNLAGGGVGSSAKMPTLVLCSGHYHRWCVTICDHNQDDIKRSSRSPGANQTIKATCGCPIISLDLTSHTLQRTPLALALYLSGSPAMVQSCTALQTLESSVV